MLGEFGAVCWQITGSMGYVGASLGLYVGNLQVLWGLLDRLWGRMLATYMSQGACWSELGAVCWQPLTFVHGFNQSLEHATFPANLQSLAFGYSFNQSLEDAVLASIVFRH